MLLQSKKSWPFAIIALASSAMVEAAPGYDHHYGNVKGWSNALTENHHGAPWDASRTLSIRSNIAYRIQHGYGLIDLGVEVPTGSGIMSWASTNQNGGAQIYGVKTYNEFPIAGIEIREQAGYGVIDARLFYYDKSSARTFVDPNGTGWMQGNPNKNWEHSAICAKGYSIQALQIREQPGYGIVDIRVYCGEL